MENESRRRRVTESASLTINEESKSLTTNSKFGEKQRFSEKRRVDDKRRVGVKRKRVVGKTKDGRAKWESKFEI